VVNKARRTGRQVYRKPLKPFISEKKQPLIDKVDELMSEEVERRTIASQIMTDT
jgi:hypothetical protein